MIAFRPPRKKKPARKAPSERVFPTHRAFVKRHNCTIPLCAGREIEFAHLRTAANSGTGMKPPDWFGIPLCRYHHDRAHKVGHDSMARENGIDLDYLFKTAAYLAERTKDKRMREAMKENADA